MAARGIALNWTTPAFDAGPFYVSQGESVLLTFTAVSVTTIVDWTLVFSVKRFHTDTSPLFTVTPTLTDTTNGVFTVALTAAQTLTTMQYLQSYPFDVWRVDSGSETLLTFGSIDLGENTRNSV